MTSECIINDWLIDIPSGSLIHQQNGEQKRLGEYQLKLLIVLIQHAGQILTREELNTLVWERRVIGSNSLPNAVHALRVALEDDGKQQRIIKTIPKKGYILESEFCVFRQRADIDEEGDETSDGETQLAPSPFNSVAAASGLEIRDITLREPKKEWVNQSLNQSEELIEQADSTRRRNLWRNICLLQCFILLALALVIWFSDSPNRPKLVEHEAGIYHNIRLLQLQRNQEDSQREDLNKLISPTLYQLDQTLVSRKVKMDVYYHSSGTSLTYTMTLSNSCDRHQLAMNIYHWRLEPSQLNALIYRETERKINEMAECLR